MQNKAEAQPVWLQLAAGAYLSLATILYTVKVEPKRTNLDKMLFSKKAFFI